MRGLVVMHWALTTPNVRIWSSQDGVSCKLVNSCFGEFVGGRDASRKYRAAERKKEPWGSFSWGDTAEVHNRPMLSPAYNWLHYEDLSLLNFNCRGVAVVRKDAAGKWPHTISWQGRPFAGTARSREQAITWIEAWINGRGGDLPGNMPRRR